MRGSRLPTAKVEEIARVYAATGNGLETARRCRVSESTVRDVLRRAGAAKPRDLYARACARGIRQGTRALAGALAKVRAMIDGAEDASEYAAAVGAAARAVETLLRVGEHDGRRRLGRLTRDKTRAETELTRARQIALLDWDDVVNRATPEQRAELLALASVIRANVVG